MQFARFTRYVAIGDSTTEGLDDPSPDGLGYLGFADRLAARLACDQPGLLYANLGIRGRKLRQIRDEQLEPALALEPDLATVVGGLNDILRPRCDIETLTGILEQMVVALTAQGATVLGMTFPDAAKVMPAARPARRRMHAFNQAVRSMGQRHGMLIADLDRHGVVDARLWAVDRLHANTAGHVRIAAAMEQALGLDPEQDPWALLPPAHPIARMAAWRREAVWIGRHATPWVMRRVRGRSSGDGRSAKRPELAPVVLTTHDAAA
jgi:lysophospholipase L1-like esterase